MGELERELTWEEVDEWRAYLILKEESERAAIEEAKARAQTPKPSGRRRFK